MHDQNIPFTSEKREPWNKGKLEHVPPDLNLEDSLRAMEGRVYWH